MLEPQEHGFFDPRHISHFTDDSGEEINIDLQDAPNPFNDGSINNAEVAEWTGHLITLMESAIDLDSWVMALKMKKYITAGVFNGKGVFNLFFGGRDILRKVMFTKDEELSQ